MTHHARLLTIEWLLILLIFCICLSGAMLLPTNQCPDEVGRLFLSDWMLRTGKLPTGNELGTMLMVWEDENAPSLTGELYANYNAWGFSYALRPYLSSMVGALFQKLAACFTGSPRILLAAARMCSVLSVTFCCFFCLWMGHCLFTQRSSALLFAALVCFLPQVMFLGMYQNNDALSLCAVSMMLYYMVDGFARKWPVKSCLGLALAFSLGLLSYYSIYGWLLMGAVFCVIAVLSDPDIPNKGRLLGRRAALIAGICLVLAGWFFLRNALLHDGDFLGIASEELSRAKVRAMGYQLHDYVRLRDEGLSIREFFRFGGHAWLRFSAMSFFGVFGYMDIFMPICLYFVYGAVLVLGAVMYLIAIFRRRPDRRDGLLMLSMLAASAVTVFLHFWHSYTRDFQPQGRYVIVLILPLAYLLAYGMDKAAETAQDSKSRSAVRLFPSTALTLLWIGLFAWVALGTMTRMLP